MPATIINNSPVSVTLTLVSDDGETVLNSFGVVTNGTVLSAGSFYRNGYLVVVDSGGVSAVCPVYLSDNEQLLVQGNATVGYSVQDVRFADYEGMFWMGFGLYVGLWVATMYMKFARAGVGAS